ncbi:MAG: succinate--CoA ligase subunit alpha [Peptococcaceae bacterium]|jgi:succinyl-CoA synthetase alpha subunit|nr:succinate--CoA ligase subunit alpha [Peptococcaceae bacterium]
MGILVDRDSRVGIAGIAGLDALAMVKDMKRYGTSVLAGIAPGRKGETLQEIPVYDTIRQAVEAHAINTMLIYVSPAVTLDAVRETLANDIKLLVIPTGNIPAHDMLKVIYEIRAVEARLIGPNTVGLIDPAARVKLGSIGGGSAERFFAPGCVGVISSNAGMTAETAYMVKKAGLGVSTAVNIGEGALIGTTARELLALFEKDPQTQAVILFCEQGLLAQDEIVEFIEQGGFSKPLIVALADRFAGCMPQKDGFGFQASSVGSCDHKCPMRLKRAGVYVAGKYDDIIYLLQELQGVKLNYSEKPI